MKWYNSVIANGIFIFLLCLGIGTCSMLSNTKIVHVKEEPKIEKVNE